MTTTDDTTTVRLSGPRGLLAAVPALLGFHPEESLVMVCLSGPRRRVGPVIRVDLIDPDDDTGRQAPLIAQLQSHVGRVADPTDPGGTKSIIGFLLSAGAAMGAQVAIFSFPLLAG